MNYPIFSRWSLDNFWLVCKFKDEMLGQHKSLNEGIVDKKRWTFDGDDHIPRILSVQICGCQHWTCTYKKACGCVGCYVVFDLLGVDKFSCVALNLTALLIVCYLNSQCMPWTSLMSCLLLAGHCSQRNQHLNYFISCLDWGVIIKKEPKDSASNF